MALKYDAHQPIQVASHWVVKVVKYINLTFQNGKHQFEATYYFSYGDESQVVQSASNVVTHTYNITGYFSVNVIVSTISGNSSITTRLIIKGGQCVLLM